MEGSPFDLLQILFNCFATEVMKDIYHSLVPTKVLEAHGVTRKFLYETLEKYKIISTLTMYSCPNKRPSAKKTSQR